jgi:anti-sigma factor RsiW
MTTATDCRRVRELMDSYLSSELTVESNHDVLRHLERCDACRAELAARQRARVLLIESFGPAPDGRALEAGIAQAIDQEQPRWWRLARYGGVAAMLALLVGAGVWFSRPVDAAAFDDSVDNHIACALTFPPSVVYDSGRAAQSLAAPYQNIVHVVVHRSGDYELIDAHACPYNNRDYAHLVYRSGAHLVSVFAEAALRGRLPLRHEPERKGYVSTGASAGHQHVFVVAEGGAKPPQPVIDELIESTTAFVRNLER